MNCDLRRSHGQIFAHWTCLYFSLCMLVVILCPAFVSYNLKTYKKTRNLYFCLKTTFFQPWIGCFTRCGSRTTACSSVVCDWQESGYKGSWEPIPISFDLKDGTRRDNPCGRVAFFYRDKLYDPTNGSGPSAPKFLGPSICRISTLFVVERPNSAWWVIYGKSMFLGSTTRQQLDNNHFY